MKIDSSINKSIIILSTFFGLVLIRNFFPPLRQLIYLIPPLSIFMLILNFKSKIKLNEYLKEYCLIFFFLFFIALISTITLEAIYFSRFLKESYFILSSFLAAFLTLIYFDSTEFHRLLKRLFIVVLLFATILYFDDLLILITLNLIDLFRNSTSETESTLAYFYGLFTIYFFLRKKYKLFFIALIFALLGSKRIVLGGILLLIIIYYLLYPLKGVFQKKKYFFASVFATLNFIVATLFYLLTTGFFEDLIFQLTGLSGNQLFMGRLEIQDIVFSKIGFFPFLPAGIGYTSGLLESEGAHLVLIHSDLLKLFIEFGMVAAWLYFFLLYKLALRNYNSLILLLFYNFIMLTDNITIYFEFMFLFLLMLYITLPSLNDTKVLNGSAKF